MRSLINILDLSAEEIDRLIKTACDITENPGKYSDRCPRKDACHTLLRAFDKDKAQL